MSDSKLLTLASGPGSGLGLGLGLGLGIGQAGVRIRGDERKREERGLTGSKWATRIRERESKEERVNRRE
eukprot:1335543-Amorphochlora_amoeboformis.AAC.1